MPLTNLAFRPAYDPDICQDPVTAFYSPALAASVAYDRSTFTFTAKGLIAAAAGLAGLLRNDGKVRIICEPTQLSPEICQAVINGYTQALVEAVPPEDLTKVAEDDIRSKNQLDFITWLVAQGRLEIRVALPKTANRGIFHAKTGVMTDADGNRVSFDGSPNETDAGWGRNYERFHVFRSWKEPERVKEDAAHFERLWNNQSAAALVIPVPQAYISHLKSIAPKQNPAIILDLRQEFWGRVREAIRNDPATTVATAPTALWPHQSAFFNRHAAGPGPDRLLIADEVGLGKTIQAGMLLKARVNQGKVNRLLILAPKPACNQWRDELRYKFCLDVPVLETGAKPKLARADGSETDAPDPPWTCNSLIASYQWLRRHSKEFLDSAPRYDMVIVDEAHRARFSDVANPKRRSPNQFLTLLRQLAKRTDSLLLLTATPMQLHEAELHALLDLLEPTGWNAEDFQLFYDAEKPKTRADWRFMTKLYQPHSPDPNSRDERLIHHPNQAYVDSQLTPGVINETARIMRERSPAKRLVSRHTRETLRQYAREGLIEATVPMRRVHPVAIQMNGDERRLYDEINHLATNVYFGAPGVNPTALGFIMTTYRRRLGSSPRAFAQTCRNHLQRRQSDTAAWSEIAHMNDDEKEESAEDLPYLALAADAMRLLAEAARAADRLELRDSKLQETLSRLAALKGQGHSKIIIFTQFRDTMLYLQDRLGRSGYSNILCISGQDDRTLGDRAQRIEGLRNAGDGLLICTETASESLNLQFCTAMINYDIPWNPMKLEQRIGRIDRIGQQRPSVDIVNLFYEDTAEWDAYKAMYERLESITENVGEYQPILYDPVTASQLSRIIRNVVGGDAIRKAVNGIRAEARLNLNELNSALDDSGPLAPAVTMPQLRRALDEPWLLPEGWQAQPASGPHWNIERPDGERYIVTTDRTAYEYAPGYIEWFGPGSPAFPD